MTQWKEKAENLVGRELSAEKTQDGKFIVLYLNFQTPPPPKADTEEEAYKAFVEMFLKAKESGGSLDEVEDTKNENHDEPAPQDSPSH